jgi:RHS repeat-associated protein
VTARGADTFAWSARGELLSAVVGGVTHTYSYDGWGRRVARSDGSGAWRYLYGNPDQQMQVTAAIEPDGTLDTLDYTDAGVLFAIMHGAQQLVVSTDSVGSPRVVTKDDGTPYKTVEYSAYGEVLSDSAPAVQLPIGFAGGIPDASAGIVHMGLRVYEPATGRFMRRDPIGLAGGPVNLFTYAKNDPITLADPFGMASTEVGVCEGICVGFKWSFDWDKGFSACVEGGFGVGGVDVEVDPGGGLDDNSVYIKAAAEVSAGPLGSLELSWQASSDGDCVKKAAAAKACVLGLCTGDDGSHTLKPKDLTDGLKPGATQPKWEKPEAKLVAGVCQKVTW